MKASRLIFLALAVLTSAAAAAPTNPYLGQAKALYDRLDFEKCLRRLEQAARTESSKAESTDIELYSGLCSLGLGNEQEAEEHFEMALKLTPAVVPPQGSGPKVRSVFEKVRARVAPTLQQPKDELKKPEPEAQAAVPPPPSPALTPAPEPVPAATPVSVTATSAAATKSFSPVPFVVGGGAIAAAIVGTVLGVEAKSFEQQKRMATFESDAVALANQSQGMAIGADVCFAVAAAALVAALVTWFALN